MGHGAPNRYFNRGTAGILLLCTKSGRLTNLAEFSHPLHKSRRDLVAVSGRSQPNSRTSRHRFLYFDFERPYRSGMGPVMQPRFSVEAR